jgi:hypothetical protein
MRDIRHLAYTQTLRLRMTTPIGRSGRPVVTEIAAEPLPTSPGPVDVPASTGMPGTGTEPSRTTDGHRSGKGIGA